MPRDFYTIGRNCAFRPFDAVHQISAKITCGVCTAWTCSCQRRFCFTVAPVPHPPVSKRHSYGVQAHGVRSRTSPFARFMSEADPLCVIRIQPRKLELLPTATAKTSGWADRSSVLRSAQHRHPKSQRLQMNIHPIRGRERARLRRHLSSEHATAPVSFSTTEPCLPGCRPNTAAKTRQS